MSWSLYGVVNNFGEVDALTGSTDLSLEMTEQVDAAKKVVKGLMESGAIGNGPFYASLNGHANADHEPANGWANDFIQVNVGQKRD